jgi:hypothetical protein
VTLLVLLMWPAAEAAETLIELSGEVPLDAPTDHVRLPFEVPDGIVEIEVSHGGAPDVNVLDWGLEAPDGTWRGWGGGNGEPAVVGIDSASRSYVPGPIPAGTWSVILGRARVSEAGTWWADVVLRDEATLAADPDRGPYVPSGPVGTGARWVAGDLHVHSRESGDARPDLDEIAGFARDRGLDFVVITDHNTVTQSTLITAAQQRNPDVLLIPGVEWTTYDGHANLLGATEWVDHKLGQPGVTLDSAVEATRAQGALFSLNHPALMLEACIGCAWGHEVPDDLDAIEVGTGGWSPVGQLFTPAVLDLWDELCDAGSCPAAVGGSDDHRAGVDLGAFDSPIGSPTTLVFVQELTVRGVLDGIAARRTAVQLQGPDDPRVTLEAVPGGLEATVTGGVGEQLRWVVDGELSAPVEIDSDPSVIALDAVSTSRVRAEVWVAGVVRSLTSHTAALPPGSEPEDEAGPGCGCASTPGGIGPVSGPLWLSWGAVLRRRG